MKVPGDFGQRIEVKTSDELEELSDQFNFMAKELHESYSQLEQKVAERTRDLAQSVAELRVLEEVGRASARSSVLTGSRGDAPERTAAPCLRTGGDLSPAPQLVEAGAHDGRLAKDILGVEIKTALSSTDIPLPTEYSGQVVELVSQFGAGRRYGTVYPLGACKHLPPSEALEVGVAVWVKHHQLAIQYDFR